MQRRTNSVNPRSGGGAFPRITSRRPAANPEPRLSRGYRTAMENRRERSNESGNSNTSSNYNGYTEEPVYADGGSGGYGNNNNGGGGGGGGGGNRGRGNSGGGGGNGNGNDNDNNGYNGYNNNNNNNGGNGNGGGGGSYYSNASGEADGSGTYRSNINVQFNGVPIDVNPLNGGLVGVNMLPISIPFLGGGFQAGPVNVGGDGRRNQGAWVFGGERSVGGPGFGMAGFGLNFRTN